MANDLNPTPGGDFGPLAINDLLPERPALIGEFSLAYEAYREAMIATTAPCTKSTRTTSNPMPPSRWPINFWLRSRSY